MNSTSKPNLQQINQPSHRPLTVISPKRLEDNVPRVLDYGNSPVHTLKELGRAHTSSDKNLARHPCIQPISMKPCSSSRLAESQVSSNMSIESITQQLERRSHQRPSQKENLRSLDNVPKFSATELKEKLHSSIKELEIQVKGSPNLTKCVSNVNQYANQVLQTQQELINLWKNRSLELEGKCSQQQDNSEYNKLRHIMESLQQKLTVLMEENQKLNQTNLSLQRQMDTLKQTDQSEYYRQQIEKVNQQREEATKRFTLEREMLENQRDQLQRQLMDRQNTSMNSTISTHQTQNHREISFKLEQAEVKLLTLQITNDNLRQDLSHKQLDLKTIENLKEKIQILETKVQELISEKEILTIENVANLNNFKDHASDQISQLQQQLYTCQQRLDSKEIELAQASQSLSHRINDHNRDKSNFELEMRRYSEQLIRESQQRQELEYERSKLKEALAVNQSEGAKLQALNVQLNQQVQNLLHIENSLRLECEQLQKHYRLLKQEKDENENRKQQETLSLQSNIQRLQQQNTAISSELTTSRQKFTVIQQEIKEMKDRLQARQEDDFIRKYEAQLISMTQRLQESDITVMQLENEKRQIEAELQRLQADCNRKIDQLNQEMHRKLQELSERAEEARSLRLKYNETLGVLDQVERKLLEKFEFEIRTTGTDHVTYNRSY